MRAPAWMVRSTSRKNRPAVVADRCILQHEHRIGRAGKFAKVKVERRIDVRGRDALHAGERLQSALRLARLGRFRAEALDEALRGARPPAAAARAGLLAGEPLGALRLE